MKKKTIKLPNNETYAYLEYPASKPILLLVHGNMSSSVHYEPLIELLKDDYHLIVPDLRGFGDSTYNTPIHHLKDLSNDLLLLMEKLNVESFHIAGWSTGGAIALQLAALKPDKVTKIVLIESASYKGYPVFQKNQDGSPIIGKQYDTKEELATDPIQVAPMVHAFATNNIPLVKQVWDSVIYTVNKPSKEADDRYLAETVKQRNLVDIDWALTIFNMSDESNGKVNGDGSISKVSHPVLSMWSEHDKVVLEYMVDETVEALENAKKVVLENSGHSPIIDCPKQLAEHINNFLQ